MAGRHVASLVRALSNDLLMHPRVPLWSSIRQLAGARGHRKRWHATFPGWLNEDFAARCGCRERWEVRQSTPPASHPVRPLGYDGLNDPRWLPLFEDCDVNGAWSHSEIRHPFLDLRLLQYMLALPAMPWCRNKLIIRRSMRRALPDDVLRRKKASFPVSPDFRRIQTSGLPAGYGVQTLRYVVPNKVPLARSTAAALSDTAAQFELLAAASHATDKGRIRDGTARHNRL